MHEIAAEGPHQYLSVGVSSSSRQTVYATTWGSPSALSSWHVEQDYNLSFGNRRLITATGSYVHVQPPPYSTQSAPGFGSVPGVGRWLGSAGGPTGELHRLDAQTGEIKERVKELIFLPGGEQELKNADKSRKALRYGAHSFDCSPNQAAAANEPQQEQQQQVAFIADLGANAVQAYSFPSLEHLYSIQSKDDGDGPRHSIPHPNFPLVFTVTEHTNFVDVYRIPSYTSTSTSEELQKQVRHVERVDMLTPSQAVHRHDWRGDTLRFSSNLEYVFATTRGKTTQSKGLLVAYRLKIDVVGGEYEVKLEEVARMTTRTSGGKANAIELAPEPLGEIDLMILTDDEEGWMDVISFNPKGNEFKVEATTQLPMLEDGQAQGASHAIWLL
nr:related to muconate cycloisomerase/conserved hypothetical protein [Melanopsichium pennsylvanicum 4]